MCLRLSVAVLLSALLPAVNVERDDHHAYVFSRKLHLQGVGQDSKQRPGDHLVSDLPGLVLSLAAA